METFALFDNLKTIFYFRNWKPNMSKCSGETRRESELLFPWSFGSKTLSNLWQISSNKRNIIFVFLTV